MMQHISNSQDKKKRKKPSVRRWLFRLLFLLGLGIFLYPMISNWRYTFEASRVIESFDRERKGMDPKEIERRINLAAAYNDALLNGSNSFEDPYAKERHKKGIAEYARMLEIHEKMGHIRIPKIMVDLPIYAGTVEEVLQKGAGHLEGSSLPIGGNNTHTVITAHRGLPEAKLFTDLDKLKIGDRFYITNIKETLAYQVDQIKTIEPNDLSALAVVPGHDYATLLTCTPYMINTHRLLVRGHRVPYVQEVEEADLKENQTNHMYQILFYITLALLILVLFFYIRVLIRHRKEKQKRGERDE